MEKCIIFKMITEDEVDSITEMDDFIWCNPDGKPMIFDSFDQAKEFQEEHEISGRVVELSIS